MIKQTFCYKYNNYWKRNMMRTPITAVSYIKKNRSLRISRTFKETTQIKFIEEPHNEEVPHTGGNAMG